MSSPQMANADFLEMPPGVVITNRIIWSALIVGQVAVAVAFGTLIAQGRAHPNLQVPAGVLILVDAGILVAAIVVTVVVRAVGYRGATDEMAVRRRYPTVMLIPMSMLEGASFFGLIIVMTTGHWFPAGVVPALAILVQLTLFPRRRVKAPGIVR